MTATPDPRLLQMWDLAGRASRTVSQILAIAFNTGREIQIDAAKAGELVTSVGSSLGAKQGPHVGNTVIAYTNRVSFYSVTVTTCDTCRYFPPFGQQRVPVAQKAVIFAVAKDLKESAEGGCRSCTLVWDALSLFRTSWSLQDLEDAIELQVCFSQPLLLLFRPRHGLSVYLDIYTEVGKFHGSWSSPHPAPLHASHAVVIPPSGSFCRWSAPHHRASYGRAAVLGFR